MEGATLYLYGFAHPPCITDCCKHVIDAGIVRVISCSINEDDAAPERWKEQFEKSKAMLAECGVSYYNMPFQQLLVTRN